MATWARFRPQLAAGVRGRRSAPWRPRLIPSDGPDGNPVHPREGVPVASGAPQPTMRAGMATRPAPPSDWPPEGVGAPNQRGAPTTLGPGVDWPEAPCATPHQGNAVRAGTRETSVRVSACRRQSGGHRDRLGFPHRGGAARRVAAGAGSACAGCAWPAFWHRGARPTRLSGCELPGAFPSRSGGASRLRSRTRERELGERKRER